MDIPPNIPPPPKFPRTTRTRYYWATRLNELIAQNSTPQAAVQQLWSEWDVWTENPFKSYIPDLTALIVTLQTTVPNRAAGADGIGNVLNIDHNSVPVYDTATNAYNGVIPWKCSEWELWHKKLEQHYQSTSLANAEWRAAWSNPENSCSVPGLLGCPVTAWCRYDCDFVSYMYSKGITIGNPISQGYCTLSNFGSAAVDTVNNVGTGLITLTKVIAYGLPIAGATAIGYKTYQFLQNEQ